MHPHVTGDYFESELGRLLVAKLLGKGKSGYSYLADLSGKDVVLKIMHDEPNPYYSFKGNKVDAEINSYKKLTHAGINVPGLLASDSINKYLVKEFVAGTVASEMIAGDRLTDSVLSSLFKSARIAKCAGFNIDYFPTNFVVTDTYELYYIDYETNTYTDKWNLENWGIYYWANPDGFSEFIKSGNSEYINSDPGRGIPVKEPFRYKVNEWINDFSR